MSGEAALHRVLHPAPGTTLSPGPWVATGCGSVIAADGKCVCVLGRPEDDLDEQAVTNGAAILALPELVAAARQAERFMAGFENDELQDIAADLALIRKALAKLEGQL